MYIHLVDTPYKLNYLYIYTYASVSTRVKSDSRTYTDNNK